MKKDTAKKTITLPDECNRCGEEAYGWFIENNGKLDYIALCLTHLIEFVKQTEEYEKRRN